MGSNSQKIKDIPLLVNGIYEKCVRLNMALKTSLKFTAQFVIAILLRKNLAVNKAIEHTLQLLDAKMGISHTPLQILFISARKNNTTHTLAKTIGNERLC